MPQMADSSLSSYGIADHGIVALWILQHGEVACVLEDHQLRTWNLFGHHLGMVELDCLVVVADRQGDGYLDLAEVVGCPGRLASPHRGDLGDESIILVRRRRQLLVGLAGRIDVTAEGLV